MGGIVDEHVLKPIKSSILTESSLQARAIKVEESKRYEGSSDTSYYTESGTFLSAYY